MHYLFWPPTQVAYSKNIEFWKYSAQTQLSVQLQRRKQALQSF